jgi:hypothetical protein
VASVELLAPSSKTFLRKLYVRAPTQVQALRIGPETASVFCEM